MRSSVKKQESSSHLKSTRVSSKNRLARDLRSDFDQFVLVENNEESLPESDSENKAEASNYHNLQTWSKKSPGEGEISFSRNKNEHIPSEGKENRVTALPKSYLLAMEHLQDVVEEKEK